jgi:hypothetical protein
VGRYSKLPEPRAFGDFTPAARPPRPVPRIHNAEKRLGPDLVDQLIADYRAGEPSTALMSKYQLGKGTVLGILENHGASRRNQPLTPEQCDEAIELYLAGWSMAKVGRHFSRAHTVIRDLLKRQNITRVRRPARLRCRPPATVTTAMRASRR